MVLGPQFDEFAKIPKPFGTEPVPEGSVRVNHFTSDDAIDSIRSGGLSMKKAHESYARGGTEYPSIFATAGPPSDDLLRARPVVEAHIPMKDLDIGGWNNTPEELEARRSTVTTNMDVPKENIIAIHEPWHQTYRYLQSEPLTEHRIMSGFYDNFNDENLQKAVNMAKIPIAAKVMLGGRLGRSE